jgi:rhodanese-related sulfurtransferase
MTFAVPPIGPAEQGLTVIDIRSAEEFAALSTTARHLPMADLLANPPLLPPAD